LIGDYLLWMYNATQNYSYSERYGAGVCQNFEELSSIIAKTIGGLTQKGKWDHNRAARRFLADFRTGKLGPITLDLLPEEIV
jgi:ribosome biogenesis GTPase A